MIMAPWQQQPPQSWEFAPGADPQQQQQPDAQGAGVQALIEALRNGQVGGPPPPAPGGLMQGVSPEDMAQYVGLGTMDDRMGMQQQALAQAQALRKPRAGQHLSWGGALGAGLGDVFREIGGQMQGAKAQAGMEDILGQQDAIRRKYAEAYGRNGQPAPLPMKVVDVP